MNAKSLLAELESLPYDERIKRMVRLGQEVPAAERDAVLGPLSQGDWYERSLALLAVYGHRRGDVALAGCRDRSSLLQGLARHLVALAGTDEQVSEALRLTPGKQIAGFLGVLRRRDRLAPIASFLDDLAAQQPGLAAVLLPLGDDAVVRRHLALGLELGGLLWWTRLARYHPALAVDTWLDLAAKSTPPDIHLLRLAGAILPILGARTPDQALRLLPELSRHGNPAPVAFVPLLRRRATAVVRWLLALESPPALSLGGLAHRLPEELRQQAVARFPQFFADPERFLPNLPPEERGRIFNALGTTWRAADGTVAPAVLAQLPRHPREVEARRHLALPALADQTTRRLAYAACLPWDEMRAEVGPWLKHPEGEIRGAALAALVRSGRHARNRLGEILVQLRQKANEQDPVRLLFAQALAELPPSRWGPEYHADLEAIMQDGLNARDLSWGTSSYFQRLLVRAVPFYPAWALRALVAVMGHRGGFQLEPLESRWSDDHVRTLAPLLTELVEDWLGRAGEHRVLVLAMALGRRLRVLDFLLDVLERMARSQAVTSPAPAALALLQRHDRPRFARLVVELLRKDESWITQWVVWPYLHRRRQNLLTPYLKPRAYAGRFTTRGALWYLPVTAGCHRWTGEQQRTFGAGLEGILKKDLRRDNPSQIQTLNQLAALPAFPAKTIAKLADDTRPLIRDVALQVLGRLDDLSPVVPVLVNCLQDDRGRVAIYALRRAVLRMFPAEAIPLLRQAPLNKVTVAKEVFRLLGEFPGEESFVLLRDAAGQDLHRDVRIALLRALWDHLERDEAWPILEQAATAPEAGPASSLIRIPDDRLSATARKRLLGLFAGLLRHPEVSIRVGLLRRLAELPLRDPQRILLPLLCGRLESPTPNERLAAAGAILGGAVPADARAIATELHRRRSNRRALAVALATLTGEVGLHPTRLVPVAQAVLTRLADDPLSITAQVRLAGACLEGDGWLRWWKARQSSIQADALVAAAEGMAELGGRPTPTPALEEFVGRLAKAKDEGLRRLAVSALVALAGRPPGWDSTRLALLQRLRDDPSPLVAGAAQFTLPDEELTGPV